MKPLDHFMYGGADLDSLVDVFSRLTGVPTQAGGSHPTLGTRNHLVGTSTDAYLELIAPDPALTVQSELRTRLSEFTRPALHRFIVVCHGGDFDDLDTAYREAGITAPVHDLHRVTPAGDTLSWKLMIPEPNDLGLFAPFFIDWQDTAHPSTRLTRSGCTIAGCEAGHPQHVRINALYRRLGVDINVFAADAPYMRVLLDTPNGRVALTSA